MPKKSSTRKKSQITRPKYINLPGDLFKTIFENSEERYHFDKIGYPGTTKSWTLGTSSKPCIYNKQRLRLQLTEVTVPTTIPAWQLKRDHWTLPNGDCWYWHLTREGNKDILKVTHRNSKVAVPTDLSSWRELKKWREEWRWIKHESTTIDPYDANNHVMKFTNVVGCNGKFYALSMQGSLVVMEENQDAQLCITGMCITRAVPSVRANYFKEYLIESRGEVLLVFLIYQISIDRVDDIEVFRLDPARLDLVKVDRLQGRTLFLEDKYCLWVNSREVGCKDDSVYFFTRELGGNGKWWMYDMKNRSISVQEPRTTDLL